MTGIGLPPPRLSRTLRGSCREQNAPPQQVEAGAAIALPFQQLKSVGLSLGLAAAQGSVKAARTAASSTSSPAANVSMAEVPRARASATQRSNPAAGSAGASPFCRPLTPQARISAGEPAGQPRHGLALAVLLDAGHRSIVGRPVPTPEVLVAGLPPRAALSACCSLRSIAPERPFAAGWGQRGPSTGGQHRQASEPSICGVQPAFDGCAIWQQVGHAPPLMSTTIVP